MSDFRLTFTRSLAVANRFLIMRDTLPLCERGRLGGVGEIGYSLSGGTLRHTLAVPFGHRLRVYPCRYPITLTGSPVFISDRAV